MTKEHCLVRILPDQLFQGCWWDHLDRRLTAYKQLNQSQLTEAIVMAETLLAGDTETLARWNAESLRWRGKQPRTTEETRTSARRRETEIKLPEPSPVTIRP